MAVKEIHFPAGVNRGLSFRQEVGRREKYYSPWAINCRMEDFQGRSRGGSWVVPEPTELPDPENRLLLNVDGGNTITDGSGNQIVLDGAESVVHGSGRIFADAGPNAPVAHPADCIYRDRFFRPSGAMIFASRMGGYTDWNLSVDVSDTGRATLMQLSEAGEIGGNVTALIPHKDQYLLAATSDTFWVVRGDPIAGGGLQNVSRGVGIIGARAWCRDHLDRYYFLSSHGLYTVGASGGELTALSEDVIPIELTGVTDVDTVLEYNHSERGVYIHIPTAAVSWFVDVERGGFWPCKPGYSGSHIAIGPIALGSGASYGKVLQIHGITASGSVSVTWRLLVDDSAEQVAINARAAIDVLVSGGSPGKVHSQGTWKPTVAHRNFPRARGKYMILILSTNTEGWGWEGASIIVEPAGAWR